MWTGKKVLVTGGTGFIGSHLVEALLGAGAVISVLRQKQSPTIPNLEGMTDNICIIQADLLESRSLEFLGEDQFEYLFHLSANTDFQSSIINPIKDLQQNTISTLNILEKLKKISPETRIIFASTAYVFTGGSETPIKEDDATHPLVPYGISKLASERYVSTYSSLFGLRTATVRMFSVYGPRLQKQIVYDFMRRLTADPTRLEILGSGTETRDMSYVGDVVRGLTLVAEAAPLVGEAYNLASGQQTTTLQIAQEIAQSIGIEPAFEFTGNDRTGDPRCWFADTSRIRALGYRPQVDFGTGIRKTLDWFRAKQGIEGN